MSFGCLWVYLEMPHYFHMLEEQKLTSTKDFDYTHPAEPASLPTQKLHPQMPEGPGGKVNDCGM